MAQYKCNKCEAILKSGEGSSTRSCSLCGSSDISLITYTEEEIINSKIKLDECYHGIIDILKYYIDTTEQNYKFISMWIIGTYFHEQFKTFPYLFFNAMRGSGKTRTLKLISSLAAKGDGSVQNNLTEAVLFRIPRGTTTCIDEVEQIGSKEKQTIRELLNSAYKRGMKVKRMKKANVMNKETGTREEKQIVETFEPYFPIVMANIWGVEEVLADRSIVLVLEKSNNPGKVKKVEDFENNDTICLLKRTLEGLVSLVSVSLAEKDYMKKWNLYIHNKYNDITTLTTQTTQTTQTTLEEIEVGEFFNKIDDSGISGRNFELLLPLLIIAKEIGDCVFEEFLEIAKEVVDKKKDEEYANSKDVSLIEFISTLSYEGLTYFKLKDLVGRFRMFIGESDEEDRWLNDKWLGRALVRLNLLTDKRRLATGREVMLNYNKAIEQIKMFKSEGVKK